MDLTLSAAQYGLVFNLMSLTVAAMFAAGIFFYGARNQVDARFRPALLVSSLVVFIAGYHYWRIGASWQGAYVAGEGGYTASGAGFNDAYRYADWLITVPLLLVELVAVLALPKAEARPLFRKLVAASVAMIALGYPGEIAETNGARWIWWFASMVPFVYILAVLYGKLRSVVAQESGEVQGLIALARNVLVATWMFYPIAYLAPVFGIGGASAEVALQVGYTIADLTAKAGFGIVIYRIARAKSEARETAAAPVMA